MNENVIEMKLLSSLEKVFADEEPADSFFKSGTMLSNEIYSFQVAYCWQGNHVQDAWVHIHSEFELALKIRKVDLVPSEMPCYADHDTFVLRSNPGLYPDLLTPLEQGEIMLIPGQWRSLWVQIDGDKITGSGDYAIEIIIQDKASSPLGSVVFYLKIIGEKLPEQKIYHTEWFHTDCIATYYGVEVFSEEYWQRVGQYLRTAVKHGINMILTPIFTPPLDTAIGGERPTVQLVDVQKENNLYSFNFNRLQRWIDLCLATGVKYFEFSHLYTQWGAKHAPKIMALVNGEYIKIFGWDTDGGGEEYADFLALFLKELRKFIEKNGLEDRCYFHVSDEPKIEDLAAYAKSSQVLKMQLNGYPIIDALSDYQFFQNGIIEKPIPALDHLDDFLKYQVPDLWTYYCCGQYRFVANRFFNMPSIRNRILGIQLYKFRIRGFLHWGYNFWYTAFSRRPIDPYRITDAGYAVPSGDAFIVYPGKDGPVESLRLEVFYEALQDMRALDLLESKIGRTAVIDLLEEGLEQPITFKQYPHDGKWLIGIREKVNRAISEN